MELFTTITGSHMWGMERPDSDIDTTTIYVMDSRDFLKGNRSNSHCSQSETVDRSSHEIGKCISMLKKMNVNFVWAVMSPLIQSEHRTWLQQLRQLVIENKSKELYWSVQGMARNNINRFIAKGDIGTPKYNKKLNTIGRTIKFAINYFLYGKFIFEKTEIKDKSELDDLMIQLQNAFNNSTYPDHPDPEPFDNYLIKLRLARIKKDGLI